MICPKTKSPLKLINETTDHSGRIKSGILLSENGTQQYPIINYIPRFITEDNYSESFSIQRQYLEKKFHKWEVEPDRKQIFETSTHIMLDKIKNAIFLDAGCGYGRFCELISNNPDHDIVGVDMSTTSIELAHKYVGHRKNVHLIQCDLTQIPFQEACFDYVFSIGVLHHTPDPYFSFKQLIPYLRSKGQISIWVYPPEMKKFDDIVRKLTTRLPSNLVFYISMIMPAIYFSYKKIRKRKLPENFSYWPCTMSFFDSWTPMYASIHTPEEIIEWFKQNNLENILPLNRRSAVTGIKP